jgi:hypothetical protein
VPEGGTLDGPAPDAHGTDAADAGDASMGGDAQDGGAGKADAPAD